MGITSMSVPSRTLCLTLEVANIDICFCDRKRLEPKELLWHPGGYSGFQVTGMIGGFLGV